MKGDSGGPFIRQKIQLIDRPYVSLFLGGSMAFRISDLRKTGFAYPKC
jgi:hypothetical protein